MGKLFKKGGFMKLISNCPVCNRSFLIKELNCRECDIKIHGNFELNEFSRMSETQLEFIKVFLCAQGNIKEVERTLGISYPTVKNRLGEIIQIINPESINTLKQVSILERIEKGEISVEEALELMNKGGKSNE